MQGQRETQYPQRRARHGKPPTLRASMHSTRGTLSRAARLHAAPSAASIHEGEQS
jgi:hypothetical protein